MQSRRNSKAVKLKNTAMYPLELTDFFSVFGQTIQDQIKRETRNSKSDFGHVLLSIFLRSNYRKEAGGGEDTDDARATANVMHICYVLCCITFPVLHRC